MALQNYVDQLGPAVSAAVLNELDQIRNVTTVPVALNSFTVSVAATFSSTLAATGAVSFSSTLAVTGATTLTGAATLSSTLAVTGAATFSSTVTGAAAVTLTLAGDGALTAPLILSSALPQVNFVETDAAANNGRWSVYAQGAILHFACVTDAGVATDFATVTRSAGVASILSATTQINCTSSSSGVAGGIQVQAALPSFWLKETDGAANNQLWAFRANAEQLSFAASNDDGSTVNNWLAVDRTGAVIDGVAFPQAGTTASAANAFLDNAASPANRLLRSTSSIRYKTDVQDVDPSDVAKLFDLRPITYRSLCNGDDKEVRWYGLIAEEVAEVFPRAIHYGAINRVYEEVEYEAELPDGTKVKKKKQVVKSQDIVPDGVQYDRLVVLLLAKLKEQQEEINDLRASVAELAKLNKG